MLDQLGGRKFVNTVITDILLVVIIMLVPELRNEALALFVTNNGIYGLVNVIDTKTMPQAGQSAQLKQPIQPITPSANP